MLHSMVHSRRDWWQPNGLAILLPDPPVHNSGALPDDSTQLYTDSSNRLLERIADRDWDWLAV